jgi:hypothetical protein
MALPLEVGTPAPAVEPSADKPHPESKRARA